MTTGGRAPNGTVLMVANYAPDVGFAWWLMENFWVRLAGIAEARGLEPLILYPEAGEVPDSIRVAGIETMVMPFPGTRPGELVESLKLVRSRRVQSVYFTDRQFTRAAYALLRLAGVRTIINHDHTPGDRNPVDGLKGTLKTAWRKIPWTSCDLQICVSPLIRERAISNARIPPSRTAVVQNGIEPIDCGDTGYVHREFDLPRDSEVCITVGRAHPYKRIDFVIEVADRCVNEHDMNDLVFVHCGDGPDMERLRGLVAKAGLKDNFILAGRRSDVSELLCSSRYAIHAAKGEAFSLAILEYMSAGLCTLVPDIPTVSQAVSDGNTGIVYSDGDSVEVSEFLRELRANPERTSRIGDSAALDVQRRFSLEQMNRQFRQVVGKIL